jgi:hypothetical protein
VEDEDGAFDFGKLRGEVGVEEEGEEGDGEEQEGAMPSLEVVVGIVENEEALNDGSAEVRGTGETGLPGQDALPTWWWEWSVAALAAWLGLLTRDVAQKLPAAFRGKEEDPMVLTTGGRSTGAVSASITNRQTWSTHRDIISAIDATTVK